MDTNDERIGLAVASVDLKALRDALASGCSPNAKYLGTRVLAHAAQDDGSLEIARLLVEQGADVDHADDDGTTALLIAAYSAPAVAHTLLRANAAIDLSDADGMTPLMAAAKGGHTALVRELLGRGADVRRADSSGRTALHWVATDGDYAETAAVLLEKGADPEAKALRAQTPRDYAQRLSRPRLLALLEAT
jgi:uncharacterized protein